MGVSVLRHVIFIMHVSANYDIVTNVPEAKYFLLFERNFYVKIPSLSAREFECFAYF
jgi:hypothetical protein